jgi:hypothetical protein
MALTTLVRPAYGDYESADAGRHREAVVAAAWTFDPFNGSDTNDVGALDDAPVALLDIIARGGGRLVFDNDRSALLVVGCGGGISVLEVEDPWLVVVLNALKPVRRT